MAIFRDEPEEFERLDWMLLQDGAVTLYFRPQVLAEDIEWLKEHDYQVDTFDCSVWVPLRQTTLSSPGLFSTSWKLIRGASCSLVDD